MAIIQVRALKKMCLDLLQSCLSLPHLARQKTGTYNMFGLFACLRHFLASLGEPIWLAHAGKANLAGWGEEIQQANQTAPKCPMQKCPFAPWKKTAT